MIGIGAFCISVARRASSDASLVSGLSSASSASPQVAHGFGLARVCSRPFRQLASSLKLGVAAPSPGPLP